VRVKMNNTETDESEAEIPRRQTRASQKPSNRTVGK